VKEGVGRKEKEAGVDCREKKEKKRDKNGSIDVPCPDPDIGLNSNDAILVEESMRLADESGYFVPVSFCEIISL
jgi:hypothetical protein